MTIQAFPKDDDASVKNHFKSKDYDHTYELSWRKTMAYENKILQPFYEEMNCFRRKLKVLTWNIWGFRYEEDYESK